MGYHDVPEGFNLVCRICGKEFRTFYYDYGSIQHSNKTSAGIIENKIKYSKLDEHLETCTEDEKKCIQLYIKRRMNLCNVSSVVQK